MDDHMTTNEVALMTGIKPGTLRYYRHLGNAGPRFFRLGGKRIFYKRSDVEAWINAAYESEQRGA